MRRHRRVALGRQPHPAQRVTAVRVVPGRQEDQLRRERRHDRPDQLPHGAVVVGVTRPCLERHVEGAADAIAPADVGESTGPGVERVLVQRHVEHARVVVEHPLGAVPVVDVVVEDRDPVQPRSTRRRGGHGDVVEQTEPHRAILFRVVPRGSDERDGGGALGEGVLNRNDGRTHGVERDVVGLGRGVGIRVEPDPAPRGGGDLVYIGRRVHLHQLGTRRRAGRSQRAAALDPAPAHLLHDPGARGLLGMTLRCLMLDEPIAADEHHDTWLLRERSRRRQEAGEAGGLRHILQQPTSVPSQRFAARDPKRPNTGAPRQWRRKSVRARSASSESTRSSAARRSSITPSTDGSGTSNGAPIDTAAALNGRGIWVRSQLRADQ